MSAGRFSLTALLALAGACALHAREPFDDPQLVSIRVQLGVGDKQPTRWDGKLSVSGGEPAGLASLRPKPDDSIAGSSWEMASWQGPNFRYPPTKPQPVTGIPVNISARVWWPPSAAADGRASRSRPSRATSGSICATCRLAGRQRFPRGAGGCGQNARHAEDIRRRASKRLCVHKPARPDGQLWVALDRLPRRGERSPAAPLRRALLGEIETVTEKPGDVFLAKAARAAANGPASGSLVRPRSTATATSMRAASAGDRWSAVRAPSRALPNRTSTTTWRRIPRGASGSCGKGSAKAAPTSSRATSQRRTVVARGKSLYVSSQRLGAGGRPPTAAEHVYVAWDTYDKGNYDILTRRYNGAGWEDVRPAGRYPEVRSPTLR